MNFKDRGNKKWNSLMLVEHQKRLKELKLRENNIEKPELDQQQLRNINFKIQQAAAQNLKIRISFYENKKIKKLTAKILKIDSHSKELKLETKKKIKKINFTQIIDLFF